MYRAMAIALMLVGALLFAGGFAAPRTFGEVSMVLGGGIAAIGLVVLLRSRRWQTG